MIILDTNVISELFPREPDARVLAWLGSLEGDVRIAAVTLAELFAGVRRLPEGRRKEELQRAVAAVEPHRGSQTVLPFDESCAEAYAQVLVLREKAGLPIATADAQVAAICRTRRATCATRNTKDFVDTGVDLVDPWS